MTVDQLIERLKADRQAEVPGFGTFSVGNGGVVVFRAGRALKAALNDGAPAPELGDPWAAVVEALHGGRKHAVRGLGTFAASQRRGFTGHNPATGQVVEVPARALPVFRADRQLKDAVSSPADVAARAKSLAALTASVTASLNPAGPGVPGMFAEMFRVPWDDLDPLIDRWCARLIDDTSWALERVGKPDDARRLGSARASRTPNRWPSLPDTGGRDVRWEAWRDALAGVRIAGTVVTAAEPPADASPDEKAAWAVLASAHDAMDRVVKGGLEGAYGNDCWWCCDLATAVARAAGARAAWPEVRVDPDVYRALYAQADALAR